MDPYNSADARLDGMLFSLMAPLHAFGEGKKRCVHDLIVDTIVVDA